MGKKLSTAVDNDKSGIANENSLLGASCFSSGNYINAIHYFELSLQTNTTHDNKLGMAKDNSDLGHAYFELGDYEKCVHYCKIGLEMSTTIGDKLGIARNNFNLANVYYQTENYENAIKYFEMGLESSTASYNKSEIIRANTCLGLTYLQLEDNRKAIQCFQNGLAILTDIGDKSEIAKYSANLGNIYCMSGNFRKAIDHYKISLDLWTEIGDKSEEAKMYCDLGHAFFRSKNLSNALDCYKQSLEMKSFISEDKSTLMDIYSNFGAVLFDLGKFKEAIDYLKKGLEISVEIADKSKIRRNSFNLGNAYYELKDYQLAIHHYLEGYNATVGTEDASQVAGICYRMGFSYYKLSQYEKAIEKFQVALKNAIETENTLHAANIYNQLGSSSAFVGKYNQAFHYHKESLKICQFHGHKNVEADCNRFLGKVYLFLEDYQNAAKYLKVSLKMNKTLGNKRGEANNNSDLGCVYQSLENYQKATVYYHRALSLSQDIGDNSEIVAVTGNLGNLLCKLRNWADAISCYKTCLEMNIAVGNKSGIADCYGNLSIVYLKSDDCQMAIEYGKKALELSATIGDGQGKVLFNGYMGYIYHYAGEHGTAVSFLLKSIKISDKMFYDYVPNENKFYFIVSHFKFHQILASCFVSLGRIESALLALDVGRAKELHFSMVFESNQRTSASGMFRYANGIWDRIENGEEKIEIEKIQDTITVKSSQTSVIVYAFGLEEFLNVWVLNDDVTFRVSVPDLEQLLSLYRLLGCLLKQLKVEVTENSSFFRLHLFTYLQTQKAVPLEIFSRKPKSKNEVEKTGEIPTDDILRRLFELLIKPLEDILKGNKLIIVPDKRLCFVPFSSLIDENGSYLSQNYSILITPSLHTLRFRMEKSHESDFGFALFVGNPTSDLENAAKEVECLSKLFSSKPIVGSEATKKAVRESLSGASIIHIAAHGDPSGDGILLASDVPSSDSNPRPDRLTQQDITGISLQARLVVLSCCHTGLGKISSEGVIGIARSFLAAGAHSVVATLWPIDDPASKEFMEAFYNELLNETPVCEALRRTKNLFQSHVKSNYRQIKIWAPFTVYGADVMFKEDGIKKIRKKSSEFFHVDVNG